jgi:hypothetical protein
MKNILFCIMVAAVMAACNQTDSKTTTATKPSVDLADPIKDTANFTSIQWIDSTNQELGKIKEGQTPELTWKFKNVGDKPLIIYNASGTCGCTVAEKPEQPIAPGEEGRIKAKFSSEGRVGTNEKQVIVMANTKGNTTHYLKFKVEVEKK